MAQAARAKGLRYLTVTEHSQTAGYAGGLKQEDLRKQWEEIDRLNKQLGGFTLLRGIESDILADGALDYPDSMLRELEVVIGSVHQRYKMDRSQMTGRIVRAFDNPHLHILGHATGRLLQRRDPAPIDMDELLDAAARTGIAAEVNGSPHRLDLKAGHVRKALARRIPLVVSADAHSTRELDNLDYAVATARKGWARRGDVLNTQPAPEFTASLRALRG
jgi:DNA polymerase (family 10)